MLSLLFNHLESFKGSVTFLQDFQGDLIIAEMDMLLMASDLKTIQFPPPSRYDAIIFLGVLEGSIELSVDYISYRVPPQGILWILPTHIMQIVHMAPNFKGWVLIISKKYLDENAFPARNSTPLMYYMQLKKKPYTQFDAVEFRSLYGCLLTVRDKIREETHLFHKEIINNAIVGFFLDLANYFLRNKENVIPPPLSRKEEIFIGFLDLLNKHCKEQHEVSFYADHLCITPQYLSLTLKEQSGRSAIQWIHSALIVEAKGLLKSPGLSIQDIAIRLNFADQSTFGKFFKKLTGHSPLMFRKT